jgi:hypothetical protein
VDGEWLAQSITHRWDFEQGGATTRIVCDLGAKDQTPREARLMETSTTASRPNDGRIRGQILVQSCRPGFAKLMTGYT